MQKELEWGEKQGEEQKREGCCYGDVRDVDDRAWTWRVTVVVVP